MFVFFLQNHIYVINPFIIVSGAFKTTKECAVGVVFPLIKVSQHVQQNGFIYKSLDMSSELWSFISDSSMEAKYRPDLWESDTQLIYIEWNVCICSWFSFFENIFILHRCGNHIGDVEFIFPVTLPLIHRDELLLQTKNHFLQVCFYAFLYLIDWKKKSLVMFEDISGVFSSPRAALKVVFYFRRNYLSCIACLSFA